MKVSLTNSSTKIYIVQSLLEKDSHHTDVFDIFYRSRCCINWFHVYSGSHWHISCHVQIFRTGIYLSWSFSKPLTTQHVQYNNFKTNHIHFSKSAAFNPRPNFTSINGFDVSEWTVLKRPPYGRFRLNSFETIPFWTQTLFSRSKPTEQLCVRLSNDSKIHRTQRFG